MKIDRMKYSLRKKKVHPDENPLEMMANLMDVMLVFACGLMLALIVNWNVDLGGSQEVDYVNGKEVTSEVTFTAEKKDGEITVRFTFDGSTVTKQTDIVVFETLYRDGTELTAHADIEDGGQTVTLTPPAPPVPQTGDNSNLGFWIGLGAVALGGIIAVVIIRVKSRKDEDDE